MYRPPPTKKPARLDGASPRFNKENRSQRKYHGTMGTAERFPCISGMIVSVKNEMNEPVTIKRYILQKSHCLCAYSVYIKPIDIIFIKIKMISSIQTVISKFNSIHTLSVTSIKNFNRSIFAKKNYISVD